MENRRTTIPALRPIEDTDVATWELPEGAIGRLGQGLPLDVEFSPDGSYFTVATKIGFWIYDTATMTPRALWGTERGMFNVATFSHDMRWIATGDQDGIVKVWNTQNGQCVTKIDWERSERRWRDSVSHVHFSPDGEYLAASGFGHSAVYAWRTDSETSITSVTVENPRSDGYRKKDADYDRSFPIAFSPDSNLFAFVSSPDTVTISDLNTGKDVTQLTGHTAPVHTLLFSPCGQYLASASLGATVQMWNIQNESLAMMPTTYEGNRVRLAYTADETLRIADVHGKKIVIWDASKGERLDVFETAEYTGRASRFSSDGTQFAICSTRGDVQIWKEGTPSAVTLFSRFKSTAESVVFLQNGSTLISNHWGTTGKVFWNVASRETQRIFPPLTGRTSFFQKGMTLSPCEELLAVDTSDANIEIWHIPSETLIAELTEHEKHGHRITLAFSPTGKYLVSAGANEAYVWDVALWEKRYSLTEQTGSVVDIAFHPDGKLFVTSSRDGTVRLWNVETGEQITPLPLPDTLEDATGYRGEPEEIERVINGGNLQWKSHQHIESIVFSPCGTLIAGGLGTWLAAGLTNEIRLWDTATLETQMIILPSQGTIRPWALAFSPCGRYLVSGAWWCRGLDKAPIRIWEVATGEHIHTFWAHSTDVQDIAFSPDGTLLASGSFDGTVLLWDMKSFTGS
ncbi:hypothetical protein F4009_23355 [Candidatus Poribacteria bacterium]|nr:hypothetical protein [Candidatus Poribacteria bacterium]MYK96896.1 hypothetical protein [Candidatus Poribacteria bacterium]